MKKVPEWDGVAEGVAVSRSGDCALSMVSYEGEVLSVGRFAGGRGEGGCQGTSLVPRGAREMRVK